MEAKTLEKLCFALKYAKSTGLTGDDIKAAEKAIKASENEAFHVYGAGLMEFNGVYFHDGTQDGVPCYKKHGGEETVDRDSKMWYMSKGYHGEWYKVACNADIPPKEGWEVLAEGRAPAPHIEFDEAAWGGIPATVRAFDIGEEVNYRDSGREWMAGRVSSLNPLKVSGFCWDEVQKMTQASLTPCISRIPVVGDWVASIDGQEFTCKDYEGTANWKLPAGENAVVINVNKDGDFQLRRPKFGISGWTYRKLFGYVQVFGPRRNNIVS